MTIANYSYTRLGHDGLANVSGYQNITNIQIDFSRDDNFDEISKANLADRYLISGETSPQSALARASCAFSTDSAHASRLYDYASKQWFMFATPLLSNGGTARGLPISCYLNNVPDSRVGILSHYTENGWLSSMGGGIGTYWGNLRSSGTGTRNGSKTSGVIPFVKTVDSEIMAFSQGGTRRGSAAVYLPINHPEIEEWVVMRKMTGGDPNRKTPNLHNAVCIDDKFMQAVNSDGPYDLIDPHSKKVTKTIQARPLWIMIMDVRKETGEPYIFFSDTANAGLPQALKDKGLTVPASNLCTEIMLPTGVDKDGKMRTAVCCLSSVNLAKFDEWRDHPTFIADLMEMLDNTLESFIRSAGDNFPNSVYSASMERSVGLGAMGFHTYLQNNGIAFGSEASRAINVMFFQHISEQATAASYALGKLRGEAPDMKGTGHRFAHKMALAPNASISIICNAISPSIEPSRANAYTSKTLSGTFNVKNKPLEDLLNAKGRNDPDVWKIILRDKGSVMGLDFLTVAEKEVFKTAMEIDQRDIVRLAGERQPYIDQGQSVNLFFPSDAKAPEINEAHMMAWRVGLKALYYLRSEAIARANFVGISQEREKINVTKDSNGAGDDACVACEG